ncbi:MAG: helix-turn-helix transcriptional regulator [Alphaproteobacteria bacterium]|nr:helix-turn-helix transcriptional regulator [Alphaproteobacteria bacterium]
MEDADQGNGQECQTCLYNASPRPATSPEYPAICNSLLDLLGVGVIVFADSKAVYVNQQADEILASCDGLRLDGGGRLRAAKPDEDRALQNLLRTPHHPSAGTQERERSSLTISRHSEKLPYPITISHLPIATGQTQPSPRQVAAFIRDPNHIGTIAWEAVAGIFDLTPTEAKLVRHLVEGHSPEDAAKLMGINVSTARWHLKQIFEKTATNRQTELVRLILGMAMPLRSFGTVDIPPK